MQFGRTVARFNFHRNQHLILSLGLALSLCHFWPACLAAYLYQGHLFLTGGISDEDALNRPFTFTLGVNNPNEGDG